MKTTAFSHEYETYSATRPKAPVVTSRRAMLRSALRRQPEARDEPVQRVAAPRPDHRAGSLEKLYGKSAPERLARMQAELAAAVQGTAVRNAGS